jgi:hypothetical protein
LMGPLGQFPLGHGDRDLHAHILLLSESWRTYVRSESKQVRTRVPNLEPQFLRLLFYNIFLNKWLFHAWTKLTFVKGSCYFVIRSTDFGHKFYLLLVV